MPIDPPQRQDSYIINPESAAEMARLIDQHRFITRYMGGLFPPDVDPAGFKRVLDLACGPGSWVQDVAFKYPETEVVGVDIIEQMVGYAHALSRVQRLDNAPYKVMDIRKPLNFEDDSFDFVNMRFLVYVLSPGDWPGLLAECRRILKPGGILRITEADCSDITNSAAYERLLELSIEAIRKTGRAFFSSGRFIGTMFMTGHLLEQAGFEDIRRQAHIMDWSANSEAHQSQSINVRTGLQLGKEFLISTGVITEEQFEELYNQAVSDIYGSDFIASLFFLSAWGRKPEESSSIEENGQA